MPPQDTMTLALAVLSTLILIRLLLPEIFGILGFCTLKNGYSGGPEDANSYWPTKVDDNLYQEMVALGFQPVGTCWEQLPFTRRFEEFVFTRPGEKCFGLLYPNDQIMPRRGSFFTVFETGGVVFTKNYCGGVEVQEGDFLATGGRADPARDLPARPPHAPATASWKPILFCLAVGLLTVTLISDSDHWLGSDKRVMLRVLSGLAVITTLFKNLSQRARPRQPAQQPVDLDLRIPLAETLARHRLNVNRLIAEGQRLPATFDGEEFLATQRRYYGHPRLRRQRQSTRANLLLVKLIVLAPLPSIFFCRLGMQDPLPWSVLLVEGVMGLNLRYGCSSATVLNILRGLVPQTPVCRKN
jgi:hypothetical protein